MAGTRFRALSGSRKLWVALLVALPLVAVAERGFRGAYARLWAPTGEARWIWAEPGETEGGISFFAYRDFELDGYPGRARVSIRADEEYLLYLNGQLVGVGCYRDGDPLATYEVGYLLEPGVNRVAAELRSGRGVGGFLLDLRIEGEEVVRVGSDESWWVARSYSDDLLEPGGAVVEPEPVRAWSTPPVGRWGLPRADGTALAFADMVAVERAQHAPRALSGRTQGRWQALDEPDVSSPPLGFTVTFDFGRVVVGYPNVVFGRKEGAKALIFADVELPDPEVDQPVSYLLNPYGRKSWSDTRPLRFRYLTVVATAEMVGARVLPVRPAYVEQALAAAKPRGGVFGLQPLHLRPPVEYEIRSELERLTSVSSGEGV